ncbi:MAG: PP2C family protein-serine/threonine phosphatase [Anaerolineae bacterium]|jgi:serine phosphatase RsbU (regulator of sigma subunit)
MVMEKNVACETRDLFGLAPQELALYPTLSAHDIQASFLPADVPRIEGWTFVASLEPACHFSGDLYDFISLPGGRWGVLIADVADKGMPAALYMALFRILVREHAPDYVDDPAACLQAVNDQLLTETRADLFVTAFYGILDPDTGEMRFSNAGHNPPYLCRRNSAPPKALQTAGMALGIIPHIQLGDAGVRLAPGDYLVLYTDGLTEAHDQAFNEFGKARLLAEIVRWDGASVGTIHHCIRVAVREFVGDAPQFDDLTLVVMGRRPGRVKIRGQGEKT